MIELPSDGELAFRLVFALLLGAVVGFEREVNDQPAGLRTHIGVSLGACLFAIVSAYGFDEFRMTGETSTYQIDVTRVASQIVSGMGFLGAGAIIKYGPNVRGLTTAASLWVAAAIGLAVAVGSYLVALVATACVVVSLALLRFPKRWIQTRFARRGADVVVVTLAPNADAGPVVAALAALPGIGIEALEIASSDMSTSVSLKATARPHAELASLVATVADRDDVASLEVG
ncbi:MAG TPA: MgtC/SapB family protein [Acidimicrobiales bacterium]|nr:MgtC/SapB family protein [Acidimicrobiales bacterium]